MEHILDETNWLVQKEGVTPTSEKQVRDVMHKYLEAYFPSYTRKLVLPKPIKSFVPDGGIADLKVGIEFKSAASDDEVQTDPDPPTGPASTPFCTRRKRLNLCAGSRRQSRWEVINGKPFWSPVMVAGCLGKRERRRVRELQSPK